MLPAQNKGKINFLDQIVANITGCCRPSIAVSASVPSWSLGPGCTWAAYVLLCADVLAFSFAWSVCF